MHCFLVQRMQHPWLSKLCISHCSYVCIQYTVFLYNVCNIHCYLNYAFLTARMYVCSFVRSWVYAPPRTHVATSRRTGQLHWPIKLVGARFSRHVDCTVTQFHRLTQSISRCDGIDYEPSEGIIGEQVFQIGPHAALAISKCISLHYISTLPKVLLKIQNHPVRTRVKAQS